MKEGTAVSFRRDRWWWGVFVLLGVLLILFARYLSPDLTFAQGDVNIIGLRYSYNALPSGLWSGWYPLEGMGMGVSPLALAPSTLIGWLAPPLEIVDLNYLFHMVAFGVGGWFLLRELTSSAVAATVAGLWFMLQPHVVTHMQPGHLGFFWMCAWMPWCLLSLRRAVKGGSPWWWILTGSFAGMTLSGALDSGILFLFFVVCYGVFLIVRDAAQSGAGGGGLWRRVAMVVPKGALAAVAMLLISLSTISGTFAAYGTAEEAPSAASGQKSSEEKRREQYLWATQWSVPVEESLDFFVPGLFGWGSSNQGNPYRGRVGQTEGFPLHRKGLPNLNDVSNYVGAFMALACVFAFAAGRRRPEVWFLAAAALVSCLLAFGKHAPLYRVFFELPMMSSIRNPIKWFVVTSTCVGMLGAIGVSELLSRESRVAGWPLLKKAALCFLPGVVVTGAGALFLMNIGDGPRWLFWQDAEAVNRGWGALRTGMLFWFLAGGVFLWALRDNGSGAGAQPVRSGGARYFPAAAGLLVLVEVLFVDLRYMPCVNADTGVQSDGMTEYLNSQGRPFRILLTRTDGWYRYINDVLCMYHGWERPGVTVSRTEDASSVFMRKLGSNPKKMLQLTNVRYLLAPGRIGDPDFVPVASVKYGDTPVVVHRFTNALERYYVVSRWEVVAEAQALDRLAAPDFDPRESVLIHSGQAGVPDQSAGPVMATCEVTGYSRAGATVKTRSSHPVVVVGLERHSASWAVFVDGKRSPMLKANWMLRACPVPAGEHTVEWRLVGDGGVGLYVGVAGWLVAALAAGWLGVEALTASRRQ